ncbi:hypothetical protein THAOC_15436, partial [Thalassiosira oceanica]
TSTGGGLAIVDWQRRVVGALERLEGEDSSCRVIRGPGKCKLASLAQQGIGVLRVSSICEELPEPREAHHILHASGQGFGKSQGSEKTYGDAATVSMIKDLIDTEAAMENFTAPTTRELIYLFLTETAFQQAGVQRPDCQFAHVRGVSASARAGLFNGTNIFLRILYPHG